MIRFQAIASGSSGNCIFLEDEETSILIDAGISCKRIVDGLTLLERTPRSLLGILVTHEHWDHIQGLFLLASKYNVPVYGTEGTLACVKYADKNHKIPEDLYHPVTAGESFTLGSLTISPVPTHHDAADPVSYLVETNGQRAAVLTDTGITDDRMASAFSDLDLILLESNHDVRMVEAGRYPYMLKRRILGLNGHLSNESAAKFIQTIISARLQVILLGHLSEENNIPELAVLEMQEMIDSIEEEQKHPALTLAVAGRYASSDVFMIQSPCNPS